MGGGRRPPVPEGRRASRQAFRPVRGGDQGVIGRRRHSGCDRVVRDIAARTPRARAAGGRTTHGVGLHDMARGPGPGRSPTPDRPGTVGRTTAGTDHLGRLVEAPGIRRRDAGAGLTRAQTPSTRTRRYTGLSRPPPGAATMAPNPARKDDAWLGRRPSPTKRSPRRRPDVRRETAAHSAVVGRGVRQPVDAQSHRDQCRGRWVGEAAGDVAQIQPSATGRGPQTPRLWPVSAFGPPARPFHPARWPTPVEEMDPIAGLRDDDEPLRLQRWIRVRDGGR